MYLKKGYNPISKNNLKMFVKGDSRTKSSGSKGGINSGISRKKKSIIKKKFLKLLELQSRINELSTTEFEAVVSTFDEEEQEQLMFIFKPNKNQEKNFKNIIKARY